ncbi:hypothetical protein K461DRAFT_279671 [Myriangium duriaei CBS 260.36]|uniref:Sequence orphan n=1 Tax=Myriangium duriaei CBS 260.36 TaxID=1168546 RepID=A0A9P4J0J0_9PEZI|nr:hypothetical protein K461DRAFT_279671 [Myriangium duriaei CBS 260.36]
MAVEVDGPPPSRGRSETAGDIASTTEARDLPALRKSTLQPHTYNTSSLGLRIAADASAALSAGALVAPLITMIDKAIIENASGAAPLSQSLRTSFTTLLTRPHRFLFSKPFALILTLYSGTYLTANLLDTTKSTVNNTPPSRTTSGPSKFLATSAANLSLCLYKDSQFTRLFGTVSTARPVPTPTYILFAVRDSMTIFASFNLPPLLAPAIPLSAAAEKYVSRASVAQFLAPAGVQLFSTPLHLLGLDLYNRNGETGWRDRMRKVRVDWLKSSVARMARIVPAFGVGGVVNTGVRRGLMERLENAGGGAIGLV